MNSPFPLLSLGKVAQAGVYKLPPGSFSEPGRVNSLKAPFGHGRSKMLPLLAIQTISGALNTSASRKRCDLEPIKRRDSKLHPPSKHYFYPNFLRFPRNWQHSKLFVI